MTQLLASRPVVSTSPSRIGLTKFVEIFVPFTIKSHLLTRVTTCKIKLVIKGQGK